MRTTLKYLSVACAGAMLFACAEPANRPAAEAPNLSADASYAQGRDLQLAGRYDEARKAYLAALAADAAHVNARNGLATVYAEQGDYAHAIPIWQGMTSNASLSSGPGTAFLFGNLGYAYYLSGDYPDAQVALEKACLLDPLNHRSWQHLGDTLFKQGQVERARQMYRQAMALRQHDFRADYVMAGGASPVHAIDSAAKAAPQPDQQWATSGIRVRADGMLELYRIPKAQAASASASLSPARAASAAITALAALAAPVEPVAPAVARAAGVAHSAAEVAQAVPPRTAPVTPAVALLEIRNGNGVAGMARSLSGQLGDPSLKVVRLTNEKGFHVRWTRVEYQGVFRASAERLAERLGSATVVAVNNCKPSDIRVVLGHDVAHGKLALRPLAMPDRTLAAVEEPVKAH